ncbi:hypothetical protein HPB48_023852 [Haemaphysalis longicornis]|uniref:SH3 domain-containing protein n=1 Tax=Haemaphysalis longicornis TaxID=44386 RepID=A0A9J6H8N4_HAELO|nr:hypothetical protein HPB48_023852 [Haemaphysalis longicornis]
MHCCTVSVWHASVPLPPPVESEEADLGNGKCSVQKNCTGWPCGGIETRRECRRTFRAMYDYVAQDVDEVSFLDGDMIVSCVPIDEGWMTGTVQRTGSTGMLPANYVEPVN